MSPRSPMARVPFRGGRGVAAWLITALLVLSMARPANSSTGEDRLTAAVLPSVVPAGVAGIAVTVAGTNFHPGGGDDDGADEPAIVCVFAGVDGPSAIVPARLIVNGAASCDVPFNPSPSGFVSVGLSANGGVDAKFFRGGAGGEVLAFAAPGALRSVVGSRTWARGDAAHFVGADMAPRDALGAAARRVLALVPRQLALPLVGNGELALLKVGERRHVPQGARRRWLRVDVGSGGRYQLPVCRYLLQESQSCRRWFVSQKPAKRAPCTSRPRP